MPTVGLLDLSGIQTAIFRSNKLPEIASASEVIEQLSAPGGLFAKVAGNKLLVAAGGNLAVTGSNDDEVSTVLKEVQYQLLKCYTGLSAVTAIANYNEGQLLQGYQEALKHLERRKFTTPRPISVQHPGWQQQSSWSQVPDPDSNSTEHRLFGDRNLDYVICEIQRGQGDITIPEKTDLMAVVSIDGLSMGKRILHWLKTAKEHAISDAQFMTELREWSKSVRDRWASAWDVATLAINTRFESKEWKHPYQNRSLHNRGFHPYRKIYQGGDDLSFVCDAHIAMAMAKRLICELEKPDKDVPADFQNLTFSAGILYVNNKFPFSRAVALSEKVRQSAKKYSAHVAAEDAYPPSSLNWWLNRQGEMDIGAPAFKGATQRPYLLNGNSPNLNELLNGTLPLLWKEFRESRGLLKSIIEAAQAGADGEYVARALKLRSKSSNSITDNPLFKLPAPFNTETGFVVGGSSTILLDAGELYDLYFPLEEGE